MTTFYQGFSRQTSYFIQTNEKSLRKKRFPPQRELHFLKLTLFQGFMNHNHGLVEKTNLKHYIQLSSRFTGLKILHHDYLILHLSSRRHLMNNTHLCESKLSKLKGRAAVMHVEANDTVFIHVCV